MKNLLWAIGILLISACNTIHWPQNVTTDFSNFEQIGDSLWIQIGDQHYHTSGAIDSIALTGAYSLLAKHGQSTVFEYRIEEPAADSKYWITAWSRASGRKNQGAIVAVQLNNSKEIELARAEDPAQMHKGWKMMEMLLQLPPDYNGAPLAIRLVNGGDDPVWFDDFKLEFLEKVYYPDFERQQTLDIRISDPDLIRLREKRAEAFQKGYMQMSSEDWKRADVRWGEAAFKGSITLKGDQLYNLYGDKWSFKIELDDGSLKGMRYFSVHNPENQYFLDEWLFHKLLQNEGVVSAQYGFAPLTLNGWSLGVYAYEERIIDESYVYRDTINSIARFRDLGFAKKVEKTEDEKIVESDKLLEKAGIQIFRVDDFGKDQMKHFEKSIDRFRDVDENVVQLFNTEKTARMLAICDLLGAYNALHWTNIRFISTMDDGLLELVGNDGFSKYGEVNFGDRSFMAWTNNPVVNSSVRWQAMYLNLFNNTQFLDVYLQELNRVTQESFLNVMKLDTYNEMKHYQAMINEEWPAYRFEYSRIYERARNIRRQLREFEEFRKQHKIRYAYAGQ